jgi:hypothetical protein
MKRTTRARAPKPGEPLRPVHRPAGMDGAAFLAGLDELGLSQNEFARRAGITRSTVNRWANNERPIGPWVPYLFEEMRRAHKLALDNERLRGLLNAN